MGRGPSIDNVTPIGHRADEGSPHGAEFSADRPRKHQQEDKLGFREIAQRLARSILQQSPSDGYVVAIEGPWGCGKTSLVNFLAQEIESVEDSPLHIVRFEPWIVGDRNGMLSELMSTLATACTGLDKSAGADQRRRGASAIAAASQLKAYASKLGRATAPLAQILAAFGVPGASLAGTAFAGLADTADAVELAKTVDEMKQDLVRTLGQIEKRIGVVIDDLDRLEPAEAVEVLRIVRAVADFPNVIYILSYDPSVLAESIQTALGIKDGVAFLKKMIQVSYRVPLPEAFDLRRWFHEECLALYAAIRENEGLAEIQERLSDVCSIEGAALRTPRDIARILNAVRLFWPPVAEKVDFADMVWLQLRRLEDEKVYSWIEEYLVEFMAVVEGASISDSERAGFASRLLDRIEPGYAISHKSIWRFSQVIPGVKPGAENEPNKLLFDASDRAALGRAANLKRLASPQHYRLYFALSKPSGTLDDDVVAHFIRSARNNADLIEACRDLISQRRPQGGTMLAVLVDRLMHIEERHLSKDAIRPILRALASCMDEAVVNEARGSWGKRWIWSTARNLTNNLLRRLSADERLAAVREMFGAGRAIGWLMCELIRGETFSHGRHGDRPTPASEWLLSDVEMDEAISQMMPRLQAESRAEIIKTPEVLSFLYGWQQLGYGEQAREWAAEQISDDKGLLTLLGACRGWRSSSNRGVYYPLVRSDLNNFLDFDDAVVRLNNIVENRDKPEIEQELAKELLLAVQLGERD
jgi:predicted KAP-like P-loop ATPase